MRIALVLFSLDLVQYSEGLIKALQQRGHHVHIFTTYVPPGHEEYLTRHDVTVELWSWFEMSALRDYDPEQVLVWNGHAPWTRAAYKYISSLYSTLVIERGWLPQRRFNYISDGLAAESTISDVVREEVEAAEKVSVEDSVRLHEAVEDLWPEYHPEYQDLKLPKKFVFLPGQLDNDTSITVSSDKFKTIDSLIGFLRAAMPHVPIVVKNHPLEPDKARPASVILYTGKLSTNDLMAQSTVVAGLTSTCLCEALALGKPVMSWGRWVGRWGAWDHSEMSLSESFMRLSEFGRDFLTESKGTYDRFPVWGNLVVRSLAALQWDYTDVPSWVCELIENPGAIRHRLKTRLPLAALGIPLQNPHPLTHPAEDSPN